MGASSPPYRVSCICARMPSISAPATAGRQAGRQASTISLAGGRQAGPVQLGLRCWRVWPIVRSLDCSWALLRAGVWSASARCGYWCAGPPSPCCMRCWITLGSPPAPSSSRATSSSSGASASSCLRQQGQRHQGGGREQARIEEGGANKGAGVGEANEQNLHCDNDEIAYRNHSGLSSAATAATTRHRCFCCCCLHVCLPFGAALCHTAERLITGVARHARPLVEATELALMLCLRAAAGWKMYPRAVETSSANHACRFICS